MKPWDNVESLKNALIDAAKTLAKTHKIEAIKAYRSATGKGFKESKDWVESLPAPVATVSYSGPYREPVMPTLEQRVERLERLAHDHEPSQ